MTNCDVVQFLEPEPTSTLTVSADDHSLPVEEGGTIALIENQTTYPVAFAQDKLSDDYDFIEADVSNVADDNPLELGFSFIARDKTGFTVQFDALPDSANYRFRWRVRITTIDA